MGIEYFLIYRHINCVKIKKHMIEVYFRMEKGCILQILIFSLTFIHYI